MTLEALNPPAVAAIGGEAGASNVTRPICAHAGNGARTRSADSVADQRRRVMLQA